MGVQMRTIRPKARVSVVADHGMNSNDNLVYLSGEGHHFVISYTLRKAKAEFREMCVGASPEWEQMEFGTDGELSYASKVLDTTYRMKTEMNETERETVRAERKKAGKKAHARSTVPRRFPRRCMLPTAGKGRKRTGPTGSGHSRSSPPQETWPD
jgi:hypothetical protein